MNFIFVVGPSGAGKSALCDRIASDNSQFEHFDLDKEVRQIAPDFRIQRVEDWNTRWEFCKQALDALSQRTVPELTYLIDSGAGALQPRAGQVYFSQRSSNLICVIGQPELIYERNKAKLLAKGRQFRPYVEFYADEYSLGRRSVYDVARFKIDTTQLEFDAALKAFQEVVAVIQKSH
jgi:shikimate kinase